MVKLSYLYDGSCTICSAETARLRRRSASACSFVDISAPGFDPAAYGRTMGELMDRIHAFRSDGSILVGMDAVRAAYEAVGLGWLAAPTRWPGLRHLFDRFYLWFARNRYRLGRRERASRRFTEAAPDRASIVAFYTATDADYGAWSRDFNMHFGYWERGMNPLDRESMLEGMNRKLVERLRLPAGARTRVADLGCGTGAVARAVVRRHPRSRIDAVTIVPAQIARGATLNGRHGMRSSIRFLLRDFTDTGLESCAYDAVYAVESSCHAEGADKHALLTEASRLLKPGGRLVIADCFMANGRPLRRVMRTVYRRWCASWAVPELPHVAAVRDAMATAGLVDIDFTDISWNVAPSIAHVPWVAGRFLVAELIKGRGRLSRWRWNHAVASVLSIVLGCCRPAFGYYMVSCRKPL